MEKTEGGVETGPMRESSSPCHNPSLYADADLHLLSGHVRSHHHC